MLLALAVAALGVAVPVDAKLLVDLPEADATLSAHGQTQVCRGPTLAAVLAKHGQPQGESLRGPALARGVLVLARDGYRVLFSLGELDPMLGAAPAILATRCDDKPIAGKDGPLRLIVPQDKRPARSVRQVESFAIVDLGAEGEHQH